MNAFSDGSRGAREWRDNATDNASRQCVESPFPPSIGTREKQRLRTLRGCSTVVNIRRFRWIQGFVAPRLSTVVSTITFVTSAIAVFGVACSGEVGQDDRYAEPDA